MNRAINPKHLNPHTNNSPIPMLTTLAAILVLLPACASKAGGSYGSTGYVMMPADQATINAMPRPQTSAVDLSGACRNTSLSFENEQAKALWPAPGFVMPLHHWAMYHAGPRAGNSSPACSDNELDVKLWQSAIGSPVTGRMSERDVQEFVRVVEAADPRYAYTHQNDHVSKEDQAVNMFLPMAQQGDAKAQFRVANVYEKQGKLAEAQIWYQRAADQGLEMAIIPLEKLTKNKTHIEAPINQDSNQVEDGSNEAFEKGRIAYNKGDYKSAINWHLIAAKQNNYKAQYFLGLMYEKGEGVKSNYSEAFKWLKNSADKGYDAAQFEVAMYYLQGKGIPSDIDMAIIWFNKAAAQNHEPSIKTLNILNRNQKNENINANTVNPSPAESPESGVNGFEKTDSSNKNHQWNLAVTARKNGDFRKAFPLFLKLAEDGDAEAQMNIGNMYTNGEGVEKNDEEAFKWASKSAEQNFAPGQHNLGNFYENGIGVPINYQSAIKWYKKAEAQNLPNSQIKLALLYEEGKGVKKNKGEAIKWYRKAADNGLTSAQEKLAKIYYNGEDVPRNYQEAFSWLAKANAESSSKGKKLTAISERMLGIMYEIGRGTDQDYTKALQCFINAADQGDSEAQYRVATYYLFGDKGQPQDLKEAIFWLNKSAAQNFDGAIELLKEIKSFKK